MVATKGQNWQDVQESVLPVVGSAARTTNEAVMVKVDQHLNAPLRLYASFPTPNALLNIGAGKVESGDGAAKVSPPADDTLQTYLGAAINLQTGAITGSGTVTRDGAAFALPATTLTQYRRMFLVYKSVGNSVDVTFSTTYADLGILRSNEDPGVKFSAMDGIPLGYIDLEGSGFSNELKTAGSATSVIENKVGADHVLFRIGSGAGTGAGGDSSFKLQSIAANTATIKKGSIRVYGSNLEVYLGANLSVHLKNDPTSGVTVPAASTQYYLYVDLNTLPAISSVGNSDRKVYALVASNFVVLATIPENTNLSRYLPIASLETDVSSNYTLFDNLASKVHVVAPIAVSPVVETIGPRSIGAVGAVANAQGALVDGDFPIPASTAFYHLNGDALADGQGGGDLTAVGSPSYSAVGFYGRENAIKFDQVDDRLTSANAFFNPTTKLSAGCWIYLDENTIGDIFSKYGSAGQRSYLFWISSTTIDSLSSQDGTAVDTLGATLPARNGWHHVAFVIDMVAGTNKIYIDGQQASSKTITHTSFFSSSSVFAIGGRDSLASDRLKASGVQDAFFSKDALTAAQINAIYSKRFTNDQQIAAGHKLTADSFPFSSLTGKISFYNLDVDDGATILDDSGNGKGLTKNGAVTFGNLGIAGLASAASFPGTTNLSSTDAQFNPGNKDFTFGLWLKPDETGDGFAISQYGGAGQFSYAILFSASAKTIIFRASTDGTALTQATVAQPGIGVWQHLAFKYTAGTKEVAGYLNGVKVASVILSAGLYTAGGTPTFRVSTLDGSSDAMNMSAEQIFFALAALSDADIRKIASARIDLSDNSVLPASQKWEAEFESEDGRTLNEYDAGWLLDKKSDKIYVDFGGASGNKVTLRLSDLTISTRTIPTRDKRFLFTSAPGATVAHGLPEMPTGIALFHNELADGKWAPLIASNHVKVDETNFYFAGFDSLTVDGTHPVLVVASVAPIALAADKKSLDNFTPNVVEVAGARTAVNGDVVILQTGAGNQTLPATPVVGDMVTFMDGGIGLLANNVTVARNGQLINGAASDFPLDVDNALAKFVFVGGSRGWQVF